MLLKFLDNTFPLFKGRWKTLRATPTKSLPVGGASGTGKVFSFHSELSISAVLCTNLYIHLQSRKPLMFLVCVLLDRSFGPFSYTLHGAIHSILQHCKQKRAEQ